MTSLKDPKARMEEILLNCTIGGESVDNTRLALIDLMESLVVAECKGCGYSYHTPHMCDGWNDARQTMLDNIGKLK